MKTTILTVPTKKTDELNWSKPLNSYLLSVYGNTTEFQQDLSSFNKLRQDLAGVSGDVTGISLYFKYFSHLELLDLRIPISSVTKRKPLNITWYDAFSPKSEHEQHSLPFEKASVLFNLGAVMTKAAAAKYNESQRSGADDATFKEAVQLLQQAAGVYEFLSTNFLHGPSSDLKPSTVRFLTELCLAQSQEIFNLKVIDGDLEQKKNSLISKLCSATAKHYEDCLSATAHLLTAEGASEVVDYSSFAIKEVGLDDESLSFDKESDEEESEFDPDANSSDTKVRARLDPFWVASFQLKSLYYRSLSYYFQGLQLEATHKYGDAIAHLTKSLEILRDVPASAMKTISKSRAENVYDLLDNYKYQKDAVEIKLKELTKDNDLVYHEIIPSTVTLPEPKPMNSAKVIPVGEIELFSKINEQSYNNFLKNVVPISIHELLSYYSEEKSQFLRNELDAVDVSNEELSSVLEFLSLPKALVNIKELLATDRPLQSGPSSSLDAATLGKVNEIASKFHEDSQNRAAISELRDKILQTISRSESSLSSSYGTGNARFREDLIKLKKSLYDAGNSDGRLFALIDVENSALYQILGKGVESTDFKNLFQGSAPQAPTNVEPEISLLDMDDSQMGSGSGNTDIQISRLEDMLNDLNTIKSSKLKLITEMKSDIHNDDISDILLLNSKSKSSNEIKTVIFPDELKKFEPYSKELDKLIERQKSLIQDVQRTWKELTSNPKVKEIQSSSTFKQDLLEEQKRKINQFYDSNWKSYSGGLAKGVGFYSQLYKFSQDLHNAIINEGAMGQATQSMGSMSLNSNPSGGSFQNSTPPTAFGANDRFQQRGSFEGSSFPAGQRGSQPPAQTAGPQVPPRVPSQQSFTRGFGNASGTPDEQISKTQSRSSDLIYDQPSTYQPNMYDFFSKK